MGRAFTVSMNLNFSGFPVGAAVAGVLVTYSIEAAIVFGVTANVIAVILGYVLIPRGDEDAVGASSPNVPSAAAD
jgi:hypothetical protein